MKEYDINEIRTAIETLNKASVAYDTGHPFMSDKAWDDLYFKVKQFEEDTGILYPDSPTREVVTYETMTSLEKVQHNHLMLSLDKTKSIDEIQAFCGNKEVIAMAKMDGLTCSLMYVNGKLTKAETRGNGIIGENILHNAKHLKNVPQQINTDKEAIVIDGEVICTYTDFEPFQDEYKNPRNFASGSIRLLSAEESEMRHLSFIAWDGIEGFDETTLSAKLDKIAEYGFEVVPWMIENPIYAINDINEYCHCHSYPIDGIVFKYNDCAEYNRCGRTEHHFKGGLAFKFYDDLYNTKLLNIEWSMGKTGVLTPIAVFEPVQADGSVIERASLHNLSLLEDIFNGRPHYGQALTIYKANQIIPQVYESQPATPDMEEIKFPELCPCCGQPLSYRYDGMSQYCFCDNKECSGRLINRLDHFFGKKGLDIKGLSKATFEKLINWGWVNSLIDVFNLKEHKDEWIKKPGFGEKSVNNILIAIDIGCICEFSSFIAGLGIPLVGTRYSKIIAEHFPNWVEFREAIFSNAYNFMKWDGFGPELHDSIMNFNYTEADGLAHELTILNSLYNTTTSNTELHNKTFVITGKLNKYKNRDALVKDIEMHGGKVVGTVSKNTTYLINNDINSTSSKNETAKKLNIPIITEEQFEDLLIGS